MTDTVRIRRRIVGAAGAPASLPAAGLAYNEIDDTLYYGAGENFGMASEIRAIGGAGAFALAGHVHAMPRIEQLTSATAVEVSGADPASLDGLYLSGYPIDGKVAYMGAADVTLTLAWSTADARWELGDSAGVKYVSSDDVETPDQATAWGSVGFDAPLVCQHVTYPEVSGLYEFDVDTFQEDGTLRYVQDVLVDAAVVQWYPDDGAFWYWFTSSGVGIAYSPSAVAPSAWRSCLLDVSGAGEQLVNGEYGYLQYGDRISYSYGTSIIKWSGSAWEILENQNYTVLYHSDEDVPSPDLCTEWIADAGPLPVPVVTLVEPNPAVVVSPVPAPLLAVTAPPAEFPVVTDGNGAFKISRQPQGYPLRFTAPAGWDTPLGLAAGLLEALEIQLAPSDGEAPGAPVKFSLHIPPNKWGLLKAYVDFGAMIAEWAEFSMSVSPGDSVNVYSVTVQW